LIVIIYYLLLLSDSYYLLLLSIVIGADYLCIIDSLDTKIMKFYWWVKLPLAWHRQLLQGLCRRQRHLLYHGWVTNRVVFIQLLFYNG